LLSKVVAVERPELFRGAFLFVRPETLPKPERAPLASAVFAALLADAIAQGQSSGVLAPGGRGLIHSIGRNSPAPMNAWIEKRIFPGAYPATLAEMMRIFEGSRLSVLDVENLRLHYAQTLKHWRERFEQNTGRIATMYDERFVRMWRLYLGGSEASFITGALQLFQVVFAHATDNGVPMTRDHLYRT
jgi:cyclopropane-fatty-acyl-phospholipid synthase